jgi:hypothetical protein
MFWLSDYTVPTHVYPVGYDWLKKRIVLCYRYIRIYNSIIKTDTAGNVVKKRMCCKSYTAQTNASNKVKRLLQYHDMELPTNLKEMIEEQRKQATLKKFFVAPQRLHSSTESINSELQEIDKIALAYCMKPTVSFENVSNIYWLAAFGEVLAPVRGKTNLKIDIKDFARRVQKDVKAQPFLR